VSAIPHISVVIPTLNRAGILPRSLESVLAQTLQPAEIVVVDDGSTDDTERVVRKCSPLIRYVRLPIRRGAQAARNRGIREARGDWIAFQDSDDEWFPDKLERQVELLAGRSFDPWTVVHGRALVSEPVGMVRQMPATPLEGDEVFEQLLRHPSPFLQAMVVSRVALTQIGGLDEQTPSYQEWDASIRLARVCRFIEPEDPVFVYHVGESDAISSSALRDVQGYQYVIDKFRDEIVEHCGSDAWDAHILHQLRRSLEFELWEEADRVLPLAQRRRVRYLAYVICRRLKLRPSYGARMRRLLDGRASRRAAAAS
jgi:glycosyltransferase involved in cell wall biosynthesis